MHYNKPKQAKHYILLLLCLLLSFILPACSYLPYLSDAKLSSTNSNIASSSSQPQNQSESLYDNIAFEDNIDLRSMEYAKAAYQNAYNVLQDIFSNESKTSFKITICESQSCLNNILGFNSKDTFKVTDNLQKEILNQWIIEEINKQADILRGGNIPAWFIYGFAAAASDLYDNPKNSLNIDVTSLKSNSQWLAAKIKYNRNNEDLVNQVACFKIKQWYSNSPLGYSISRIIFEINHGADFDLVYQNLEDLYK